MSRFFPGVRRFVRRFFFWHRDGVSQPRHHKGGIVGVVMPIVTFDLSKAKTNAATVVRRDAADVVVEVVEFTQLPDSEKPVRVLFRRPNGTVYSGRRHRNGQRSLRKQSEGDLLIKTPDQRFVNLSRDGTYDLFTTKVAADRAANDATAHRAIAVNV